MEPIRVPGPPIQAFNKNRPISDLIRAQTNHLKHIEQSLSPSQRQQIPQHAVVTEADAANYIAAMTRLFQTRGAAAAPPAVVRSSRRQPIPIRSEQVLQLAASAAPVGGPPPSTAEAGKAKAKTRPPGKGKKR